MPAPIRRDGQEASSNEGVELRLEDRPGDVGLVHYLRWFAETVHDDPQNLHANLKERPPGLVPREAFGPWSEEFFTRLLLFQKIFQVAVSRLIILIRLC